MAKEEKSNKWFKKVRGSYLPITRKGWLAYIPFVAYMLAVLVFVTFRQYDIWKSLLLLVPNYVVATAIMTWIAAHKS